MSSDHAALSRFLSEDCGECGTPGYQRHLSAVGGCTACAAEDPRPVYVPLRNAHAGVLVYDMVLPKWPGPPSDWRAPFRDRIPRAAKCYRIGAGMVHVKPDCRC